MSAQIYLGSKSNNLSEKIYLDLKYANRHGLIAGATGTGKTVTIKCLAESFSREGVPVFISDAKGDLSGLAQKSDLEDFLIERAQKIGFSEQYNAEANPAIFWDLFGKTGLPLRTTIAEVGPLLLARILELNEVQEGVLNIAFTVAENEELPLLDLKDLKSILISIGKRSKELSLEYGNISQSCVGAIQRRLLQLEQQGGKQFFGEAALELNDFIQTNQDNKGYINILSSEKLMQTPRLYATFLLWLLSELFEELPEIGDQDKPKLIFFFDEAHLLFKNSPKALIEKIEQVVKLIRSKGVGIYFITQSPSDIPDSILSQLGNRIQHALRAFTPKQAQAIKLAAQTYRKNPDFDVEKSIIELGVGEALISTLEGKGQPSIVQRVLLRPPYSRLKPADKKIRTGLINSHQFYNKYNEKINRKSAYEILKNRAAKKDLPNRMMHKNEPQKTYKKKSSRQSPAEAFTKSLLRQIGRQVGRQLVKGLMGALKR